MKKYISRALLIFSTLAMTATAFGDEFIRFQKSYEGDSISIKTSRITSVQAIGDKCRIDYDGGSVTLKQSDMDNINVEITGKKLGFSRGKMLRDIILRSIWNDSVPQAKSEIEYKRAREAWEERKDRIDEIMEKKEISPDDKGPLVVAYDFFLSLAVGLSINVDEIER